tara:strand:+ start:329 stop:544 length:216 start_codon:yes stop_codon:yes gene_type:complete
MPIYTYKCPKCCDTKDILGKLGDDAPFCKDCSTPVPRRHIRMERIYGSTGKPQFKGNGFYETDYKKKVKPG